MKENNSGASVNSVGDVYGQVVQAHEIGTLNVEHHVHQTSRVGREASVPAHVRAMTPDQQDVSPLFGRDDEIALLQDHLRAEPQGETGILVVTGMPGAGKTALAVLVAKWALGSGHFPGGVVQADFRGYVPGDSETIQAHQVLPGLLYALGQNEIEHDPTALTAQFHQVLHASAAQGRPVLLLFDNVSSASQVLELIPQSVVHRVIVTSRESMASRFPNSLDLRLAPLRHDDAIELLRSRARSSIALPRLAELCGGLPLALQVVSSILRSEPDLAPEELAEELAEESERLAGLNYEDLGVGSSLRLSYVRLSEDAAAVFRFVSAHPGTDVSVETASRLAGQSPIRTRRAIRALEYAHLLERAADPGWWRIHDLVRLFGLERLVEREGEAGKTEALTRLFDHYAEATRDAASWVTGRVDEHEVNLFPNRHDAIRWLDREFENVAVSVELAQQITAYEPAWIMAISLAAYLSLRSDHRLRLHVSNAALQAAQHLADDEKVLSAVNNIALTQSSLRLYDEAFRTFKEGIKTARDCGNVEYQIRLLVGFGSLMRERGDVVASIGPLRRAFRLADSTRDQQQIGYCLTNLGMSLRESGQAAQSVPVLRLALECHRSNGARLAEASTLCHLGTALLDLGVLDEAEDLLRMSVALAGELGDRNNLGMVMNNLANAYRIRGDDAAALAMYEECLGIFEGTGDVHGQVLALGNIARTHRHLGNHELVERAERQAARLLAMEKS